jgi:hypothetical protein
MGGFLPVRFWAGCPETGHSGHAWVWPKTICLLSGRPTRLSGRLASRTCFRSYRPDFDIHSDKRLAGVGIRGKLAAIEEMCA